MLGNIAARRRARRVLGPWLLAGVGVWLAFDNGPALLDEWRLRGASETGTATVVSTSGGLPQRAVRRFWDDLFWGRGRRVTYQFAPPNSRPATMAAFVTHRAASRLQQRGTVGVRYLSADPNVQRIDGEPGILILSFRLLVALAMMLGCIVLLLPKRSRTEIASAPSGSLA
jgi:hypothetical protein